MAPDTVRLWIGTSPEEPPRDAAGPGATPPAGIWSVDLDVASGRLAEPVLRAPTPAPSFLALTPDGRVLVAAGETSPGAVTVFAVGPDGSLVQRERVSSGGSGPCHVLVHPSGRALYVANYGSGSVGVVPLRPGRDGAAGLLSGVAQVFEHSGRGPVAGRQEAPHVHSTLLTPDGSTLLALDLGTDEIRRYRVRPDALLDADGVAVRMPRGTGPRHAAWGPHGHLVVTGELDAGVHVLAWDGRELHPTAVVPALPPAAIAPDGLRAADGEVLPAHVVRHGDRVLVSVRGPDVLSAWRFADDGARLEPVAVAGVDATWPRHFALVGDAGEWVVVAGQRADRVLVLPAEVLVRPGRGDGSGRAGPPGAYGTGESASSASLPAPTCVVAGRVALPDGR